MTAGSFVGKTFIISDLHSPFEDKPSIEKVKQKIKDFKPDRLIVNGDAADCFLASRFVEATLGKHILGDAPDIPSEMKYMVTLLDSLADECPAKCELIFICGNHELRIERQLDRIRHIVGQDYDPMRNAFASSKYHGEEKRWFISREFPHGRFVICDDRRFKIVVKHAGKGTGLNYAAATWRHGYAIHESYIIGDTHKTISFEGRNATNPRERDDRFVVGIGFFGNLEEMAFHYIEETASSWWDRSVAEIHQEKSGKFTLDVVYI